MQLAIGTKWSKWNDGEMSISIKWTLYMDKFKHSTTWIIWCSYKMDWWEAHKVKLDWFNKKFGCIDEDGVLRIVKRIPKSISIK